MKNKSFNLWWKKKRKNKSIKYWIQKLLYKETKVGKSLSQHGKLLTRGWKIGWLDSFKEQFSYGDIKDVNNASKVLREEC